MTVGELLDKISSKEISEWMAYYLLQDESQNKNYNAELQTEQLTDEQRAEQIKKLFLRK